MEGLAVFTALNHSGSFRKNFAKFKKHKYVIYRLRVDPYGKKLWPRSWKCWPRPTTSGSIFKTSVTVFHHTDLPAGKQHIFIHLRGEFFFPSFFLSLWPSFFLFRNSGLVNGYPEEYEALTLAGNKTNKLNNVSVIFKQFNISDKINLFSKGNVVPNYKMVEK